MSVTVDVLSQTVLAIEDETSMALTRKIPFLERSKSLGKIHSFPGSYAIRIPVEVQAPSNTTVLSTGYENIDLTARDATNYAQFSWLRAVRPVSVSGKEKAENSGEYQMVDLVETKYKSALAAFMREVNKQITVGSVTSFGDLGTLNGAGSGTGFLEDAAPGSQNNTVGGLSKSTYSTVPGWNNQFYDMGATYASNAALVGLRKVRTGAALNRPVGGDDKLFHTILAHQDFFNAYEADLFANTRYVKQSELDGGAFGLLFQDAIVTPDPDLSTQGSGTLSNGEIAAYCLNLDGIQLAVHDQGDFKFEDFIYTQQQDVISGKILFMGGLIARNLGASGIITF